MRILVLSFYYQPDLCAGSFRTSALVEQLNELNVDVEVVTTMPNRYATFKSEAREFEAQENLKVYRLLLPEHNSGMLDQIRSFYSFYNQAMKLTSARKYDIVYATSSRLFTAFLGKRISRKQSVPIYLDIRDIFLDTLKDVLSPLIFRLVSPILSMFEKYTFDNVNHINLVSKGFGKYFKEKSNCDSYSFFTNGIDDEFINKDFSITTRKNQLSVLYAGNIGEGQALHRIVPGLALLGSDYKFTIIGDGGERSKLVAACDGINNVEILHPVNRRELIEKYKQADVLFVHLNDYDAFKKVLPSKLFEYGATGKPILAGVAGYAAEFITTEIINASVFAPTNVEQAFIGLTKLKLEQSPREDFINKFQRSKIMLKLSQSIINSGAK